MSGFESIAISEIESADLDAFYEQQLDPEAIRLAAFVCADPKDRVAFDAHWAKILNSAQNTTRTIVAEGQVAGSRWVRLNRLLRGAGGGVGWAHEAECHCR